MTKDVSSNGAIVFVLASVILEEIVATLATDGDALNGKERTGEERWKSIELFSNAIPAALQFQASNGISGV